MTLAATAPLAVGLLTHGPGSVKGDVALGERAVDGLVRATRVKLGIGLAAARLRQVTVDEGGGAVRASYVFEARLENAEAHPREARAPRPHAPPLHIERAAITSADAIGLIRDLDAELMARYPEEGTHTHFRLDAGEVSESHGGFLVARSGGRTCGCGAVRRLDATTGEIKRMYVAPEARGLGVGRAVLIALEDLARTLGLQRLMLETGPRQPEALALYELADYRRAGAFGEYTDSPLSLFLEKAL